MHTRNNAPTLLNEQQSPATITRVAHLVADPAQRKARANEKRTKVLRFLRDEIWTITEVVARLLGLGYPAAHTALKAMARDGLINSEYVYIPARHGTSRVVLHGITAQGLAYAWNLDETPLPRNPWEPSKTNALFVPHQIAIQLARVEAEKAGWREWKPARTLMGLGLPKLPDAEAIDPDGQRVAIELEREIKTDKRYEAVIGAYIAIIKKDHRWNRVDYICPDADFAARLARVFGRLKQLRLESRGGQPAVIGQLQRVHLERFRFYAVEDWPNGKFVQPGHVRSD